MYHLNYEQQWTLMNLNSINTLQYCLIQVFIGSGLGVQPVWLWGFKETCCSWNGTLPYYILLQPQYIVPPHTTPQPSVWHGMQAAEKVYDNDMISINYLTGSKSEAIEPQYTRLLFFMYYIQYHTLFSAEISIRVVSSRQVAGNFGNGDWDHGLLDHVVGIGTGAAGAVGAQGTVDVGGVVMGEVWNFIVALDTLLLAKERPCGRREENGSIPVDWKLHRKENKNGNGKSR